MAMRWPFGAVRVNRRTLFKSAAIFAAGFGSKWMVDKILAADDAVSLGAAPGQPVPASSGTFIDVREFKKTTTVEELNRTAEAYFARLGNWDFHHAIPLWHPAGTPAQLNNFAHVLHGLQLLPGMSVLDFGAGSCWASRWLSQMGMGAIALDVSPTALKIGQALYQRLPVIGERPKPRFLLFDGHRIDLPDASVDRILCMDTFHHLLNPDEVLREMSRILKPAGIAGFVEPGPMHSRTAQSQFEMRSFKVLEDDVHIAEIWTSARQAGFARIRLALYSVPTYLVGFGEFEDYMAGGIATRRFAEITRAQMEDRRTFFLQKAGTAPPADSRSRDGLRATFEVRLSAASAKESTPLTGQAVVTNAGSAIWLPRSAGTGGVQLTSHLLDPAGKMLIERYSRHALTSGEGRTIAPGETVNIDLRIPAPAKGRYVLEFDLASEGVVLFSVLGGKTVRLAVEID